MKSFLPCPSCDRAFPAPNQAGPQAVLRCPGCRQEFSVQSLMDSTEDNVSVWEVVENAGEGNVFSEVQAFEMASVSEDAVSFEKLEPTSVEGYIEEQESQWSNPSADFAVISPDDEDSLESEALEHQDGLAALALAANGDPDTFVEALSEDADAVEPTNSAELNLHESESSEEQNFDLVDAGSDVLTFDDELTLDEDERSEDTDIQADVVVTETTEASNESDLPNFEDEEPIELEEEAPVAPAVLKPRPTIPSGPARTVAPDIDFDLSTPVPKKAKKGSPLGMLVSVLLGGVGAIPIALMLIWHLLGTDPFETGPIVAQYVPWIVPEGLRGPQAAPMGQLPRMQNPPPVPSEPTMSEPVDAPTEPTLAGQESSTPAGIENFTLPPVEPKPSAIPNDKAPEEILDPTIFSQKRPDLEAEAIAMAAAKPIVAEKPAEVMPKPITEVEPMPLDGNSAPPPKQGKKKGAKIANSEPVDLPVETKDERAGEDEALRNALTQVEAAFANWNAESKSSKTEFIQSLHAFGSLLARISPSDPRLGMWRNQALPVLSEVVAKQDMLKELLSLDLSRDDGANAKEGWVGVDFIVVKGGSDGKDPDLWKPVNRFRSKTPLASYSIFADGVNRPDDGTDARFFVVGVVEPTKLLEGLVFRTLLAIRK